MHEQLICLAYNNSPWYTLYGAKIEQEPSRRDSYRLPSTRAGQSIDLKMWRGNKRHAFTCPVCRKWYAHIDLKVYFTDYPALA